jgi:hypothetical protein
MGNVWLRGLWKIFEGGGRRECWEGRYGAQVVSGENVNGVVGLVAPPEKEEGAVSVNPLLRDVVL